MDRKFEGMDDFRSVVVKVLKRIGHKYEIYLMVISLIVY